ncbi:DNA cytosine methyltransferase [Cupriavidus alkaliphilus]|uniref:DNA cytosine methyltransferase n=1 Tax=Cupriavidus alkaliphilus TaxID=942866 RepID=UPI00160A10DC|nr:DNA cytosine methyltransferase [Cupriavidus alkaliphilus]MBB3015953.1 DNA (cytosine-5)-methyltransferase 1 [Cupriavidus alkaliphilus]
MQEALRRDWLANQNMQYLADEQNLTFKFTGEGTPIPASVMEIRNSDSLFLRAQTAPQPPKGARKITIVDLFCGAGGITLGFAEAAHSHGCQLAIKWAVDFEARAIDVYRSNFPSANAQMADLSEIFLRDLYAQPSKIELEIKRQVGTLDILVGGPPCQGHSDLNNYSRRNDPKNSLYLVMARAAAILKPKFVLIENVPGARHDKGGVFFETASALQALGYHVTFDVVDLRDIGVPQSRRRLVLLASKSGVKNIDEVVKCYRTPRRDLAWAIEDLTDTPPDKFFNMASKPSPDNKNRIDFLFEQNLYDLPDSERPPCHRDGKHSYKSIYGRLKWNEPAQTITSGFYSMCMGRYVHPANRRTLTAHEAARIQFFPDYFDFTKSLTRTALAQIIGNAVPPKLSFVFGHYAIAKICEAPEYRSTPLEVIND